MGKFNTTLTAKQLTNSSHERHSHHHVSAIKSRNYRRAQGKPAIARSATTSIRLAEPRRQNRQRRFRRSASRHLRGWRQQLSPQPSNEHDVENVGRTAKDGLSGLPNDA